MLYKLVVFLLCIWAALFLVFAAYGAYTFSQVGHEPYRCFAEAFAWLTVFAVVIGVIVYKVNDAFGGS